jgi:hypothetical protein
LDDDAVRVLAELTAAVVAVSLLGAAAAKVEALGAWVRLVRRFPFRPGMKLAVAVGVPVVEVAIGVLALASPPLGLSAAAALLLAFAAVLARYLGVLRGSDCHCFGRIGSSPIDTRLVVRNIVLAGLAAVAAMGAWGSGATAVPVLEIAVVAVLGLALVLTVEYRSLPKVSGIGELRVPVDQE